MAKRASNEKRLEAFSDACASAAVDELVGLVRKALKDSYCRLVANAASLCGDRLLYGLEDDLITAYPRFLDSPVKKDPHCIAKGAIVRALVALDSQAHAFFLAGMRYHQLEPGWGGATDTALDVRVSSAMGLVGTAYDRTAVAIAEMLTDTEAYVRAGAVRALACIPEDRAEPLLRFKALCGDPESDVTGACFGALLQVNPDESTGFIADFLESDDPELNQHAALALGESRDPIALQALIEAFDRPYVARELRRMLLRGVVLQRTESAYEWLLQIARERDAAACALVIEELGIYKANDKLKACLAAVLSERDDLALLQRFERVWSAQTT